MKYLGVDFGLRKIGLAISEGELASPMNVIYIKNQKEAVKKIEEIVKKNNIDKIVIGLPDSGVRSVILKIAANLRTKIPVETVDETLSSKHAKTQMIELGINKKKRTEEDAFSAALILQEYLDNL